MRDFACKIRRISIKIIWFLLFIVLTAVAVAGYIVWDNAKDAIEAADQSFGILWLFSDVSREDASMYKNIGLAAMVIGGGSALIAFVKVIK